MQKEYENFVTSHLKGVGFRSKKLPTNRDVLMWNVLLYNQMRNL